MYILLDNTHNQGKKMKITMAGIAKAVGVSQPAVSAVLNNRDYCRVSPEKREAILNLAKELNFRPNLSARRLCGKSTNTIAIFTSRSCSVLQNEILRILIDCLQKHQLHSYTIGVDDEDELNEKLLDMQALGVDAFIGFYLNFDLQMEKWSLPAVSIGVQRRKPDVAADTCNGAKELCIHLLNHGYRKLTFLCDAAVSNSDKISGIEEAIREWERFPVSLNILEYYHNPDIVDEIHSAIRKNKTDVFMASNDMLAGFLMGVLRHSGIPVPEQVAITGFDGLSIGMMTPLSLTTAVQSPQLIAERSVELLRSRMADHDKDRKILLPVTLRIGESCGCKVPFKTDFLWDFMSPVVNENICDIDPNPKKQGVEL